MEAIVTREQKHYLIEQRVEEILRRQLEEFDFVFFATKCMRITGTNCRKTH